MLGIGETESKKCSSEHLIESETGHRNRSFSQEIIAGLQQKRI